MVTIDRSGSVWRTGGAVTLATTAGAFQTNAASIVCATETLSPFQPPDTVYCAHAFLVKQDGAGKVSYATWLGGASQDSGTAVTTDSKGNVYVAGYTYSPNFPVTTGAKNAGPYNPALIFFPEPFGPKYIGPGGDAFAAKFAGDGTLVWSTLIGGTGNDVPSLLAVDGAGNVYLAGTTTSTNFPVRGSGIASSGGWFFARLNSSGTSVDYGTYSANSILGFDVDAAGRAYLTGESSGEPYVAVVDTAAGSVSGSRVLSGFHGAGTAVAADAVRNVFVTVSPAPAAPVPYSVGPPFRALGASTVLKLSADLNVAAETDVAQTQFDSLALDSAGNVYAFGHGAGALPAAAKPGLSNACSIAGRSFVVVLNAAGQATTASYFRQGDDSAVAIQAPGLVAAYRAISSTVVTFDVAKGAASFECPANLASGAPGHATVGGELFVLMGTGLGPAAGIAGAPDAAGRYPTSLGGVRVLFAGTAVPLLFVSATEIHAVAPWNVGSASTIQVENGGSVVAVLDVTMTEGFNPGLFHAGGQGAVVNQDGTVNSPSNPAEGGSFVSMYATGTGPLMDPETRQINPLADGQVTPIPPPFVVMAQTVYQVTFNGVPGVISWIGSSPGIVAGVTQINVRVPTGLAAGQASVVLNVGTLASNAVFVSLR